MMDRYSANKKILDILAKSIDENHDTRFIQILWALGIINSKNDIISLNTSPNKTAVFESYLLSSLVLAYRMQRIWALVKKTSNTKLTYFIFCSKLSLELAFFGFIA